MFPDPSTLRSQQKNTMVNLKFKKCWVSVNGDYYQIIFDNDLDEPDNYDDIMKW